MSDIGILNRTHVTWKPIRCPCCYCYQCKEYCYAKVKIHGTGYLLSFRNMCDISLFPVVFLQRWLADHENSFVFNNCCDSNCVKHHPACNFFFFPISNTSYVVEPSQTSKRGREILLLLVIENFFYCCYCCCFFILFYFIIFFCCFFNKKSGGHKGLGSTSPSFHTRSHLTQCNSDVDTGAPHDKR